ncbi:chemotaxis protein CheW [Pseudomonas citronellolis]|uniref:chemotaxis protein CheW n=1 Tax=Pseudomonas citronellolis TaxID=53408 RepID=UPI0023E3BCD1|nr:chemotaxis protein CheW [Pseudomonas citronellolis]MDF3936396.1 chemotaxis protein CheW [Pseudomonas citronellolis]
MFEQGYRLHAEAVGEALDDCWNRIGVHGDKSCPQLLEHIHCRNCPVYASAAVRLLDRYALGREEEQAPLAAEDAPAGQAHLLFRIGEEWLALRTLALVEVAPACIVHSLPHQRSPVLLGVANVRGALVACLSLAELLGLSAAPAADDDGRRRPRMLILACENGPILAPVDDVEGIHPLLPGAPREGARYTLDVQQWRGRSVRLLDHQALLAAAARSLA